MSKHTQGPLWVPGYRMYAGSAERAEYPIHAKKRGLIGKAYKDADARLWAAAPELLEALQSCADLLVFLEPSVRGGYSPDGALEKARSAIAKATGEQQ